MNPTNVGRNIRALRKALGWTQEELGQTIAGNVTTVQGPTVSNMENGKTGITRERVAQYARALGVVPSRLYDETLCATCHQQPPRWFTCRVCGTEG
jgi:transcriptional regulator with XRE-family HTH domain